MFQIIGLTSAKLFSQEVTVKVNGEVYSKEYPKTYEEAIELINIISEMEINADDRVVELEKRFKESTEVYEAKIKELKDKIEAIEKYSENTSEDLKTTEKVVNDYASTNTRFTFGTIIGPAVNLRPNSVLIGTNIQFLGEYRLLRNFHLGGSIFFNIFNSSEINTTAGIGLYIGYSIK